MADQTWQSWLLSILLAAMAAFILSRLAQELLTFMQMGKALSSVPWGPQHHPLLGHLLPLARGSPWELMTSWVRAAPPIIKLRVLNTFLVIVGSPEGLKHVFQTRQRLYQKDTGFSYRHFLNILGSGLVTSEGPLWQRQRVLMGPVLRVDILDSVVGIAQRAADRLTRKLEAHRGSPQPVEMEEEFRLLTLQIIGEAILSLPPEECDQVFPQLYLPTMTENNRRVMQPWREYLPSPGWFRHRTRVQRLNSYIVGRIRERWAARRKELRTQAPDILDRIIAAMEASNEGLTPTAEQQICYEIKTFLLAGHETSAAMLTWSLYELAQRPQCLQQVQAEAQRVFGDHELQPTREAAESLQFTLSCLKESLRRYTVVPIVSRQLAAKDELCGHMLPAGCTIICSMKSVHQYWSKPDLWQPERFMPGGEFDTFEEGIRPYMFMPFIQGPRNCLGQNFALLEARVVLSLLLKRFSFECVHKDAGMLNTLMIPAGPLHGMHMLIK